MRNITPYANNIFEQPWWLDIVAPNMWKEILVKDSNEDVIARQVVVGTCRNIYMPKLTQTLGTWVRDDLRCDYSRQKEIVEAIVEQIREYKNISLSLSPENSYVLPFRWAGFMIEPRFTYRINDMSNLDELYSGFSKTAKKNIRYAQNKVKLSYDLDVEELYSMLVKTFEIQNRKCPLSKELISNIVLYCEKNGNGKYICARDESENVHACAYFVYDEKVCYYLFGATDLKFRSSGAQSLIIWDGIKHAAQHSKVFDFEGSMIEGIEHFFKQFNCECTVYYEIRKQCIFKEILMLLKPKVKKILNYRI